MKIVLDQFTEKYTDPDALEYRFGISSGTKTRNISWRDTNEELDLDGFNKKEVLPFPSKNLKGDDSESESEDTKFINDFKDLTLNEYLSGEKVRILEVNVNDISLISED